MSLRAVQYGRSWGAVLALIVALMNTPAQPARAQPADLPRLGEAAGDELSPTAERKLGEAVMRELRRSRTLLDDPEFSDYLNRLADRLAAQPGASGFSFDLFGIEDRSINAFALPGGFIGVHTGLIAAAQAESELASVIAHEIGHVTQRHIARMLSAQRQSSSVAIAALIGALLAARANPQAAVGIASLGTTVQMQQVLGFSRDAEREADRAGLEMLQQAGFDPQAAVDFFGRLQAAARLSESTLPAYLRTHPLTGERMTDIQNRLLALRYRQHADSVEFTLLRARLRMLADRSVDGLLRARQLMSRQIDDGTTSAPAGHYALAAGTLAMADTAGARQSIGRARQAITGSHPLVENLAALIELEAGQPAVALVIADRALERFGPSRALMRTRIRALSMLQDWPAAVAACEQALESARGDTELWELLARAQSARGRNAQAHLAMAEVHTLNGTWLAAIEQLLAAQRERQLDFYTSSQVDTRLRELRAVFLQEREDRRAGR